MILQQEINKGEGKMVETKHHVVYETSNIELIGLYEFIKKYAPVIGDSRMFEDLLDVYYSLEQDLKEAE
jgi:hypothetical protein